MTRTWAQHLAARDRRWCVFAVIEGVGPGLKPTDPDYEDETSVQQGCYRWCNEAPDYAEGNPYWAAKLVAVPDSLSERITLDGGVAELGNIVLDILADDASLNALRSEDPDPAHYGIINPFGGTIVLTGGDVDYTTDAPSGGVMLWTPLGEAIQITGSPAGTTTNSAVWTGGAGFDSPVLRTRQRTFTGPVYESNPFILGRTLWLYVCPSDAADDTQDQLLGEFIVEAISAPDTNTIRVEARSQSGHLGRMTPFKPDIVEVETAFRTSRDSNRVETTVKRIEQTARSLQAWTGGQADDVQQFHMMAGDEIIGARHPGYNSHIVLERRGKFGTELEEIKPGTVMRRVFIADERDGVSDFRFSPNRATLLSDSDWTITSHWIDILLSIMLSSAEISDGGGVANAVSPYPGYGFLPIGYGLGIPATQIDWPSWMGVRLRTLGARFNRVVYGPKVRFNEWASENFLRPLGASIISDGGKIKMVLPRNPVVTDMAATIDTDAIVSPDMELMLARESAVESVTYRSGETELTYRSGDYETSFGLRRYYEAAGPAIVHDVEMADPLDLPGFRDAAARRLLRSYQPSLSVRMQLDVGQWDNATLGSVVEVSVDDLPQLNGIRGFDALAMQVLEREPDLSEQTIAVRAVAFAKKRQTKLIAPCAHVESVSGSGPYVATVLANRYTSSDGGTYGLPANDALAFEVGDVVKLVTRLGASAGGTTQEVTAVATSSITLDGNFSGNLAADTLLVFADRPDATGDQTDNYAFVIDVPDGLSAVSYRQPDYYGDS